MARRMREREEEGRVFSGAGQNPSMTARFHPKAVAHKRVQDAGRARIGSGACT